MAAGASTVTFSASTTTRSNCCRRVAEDIRQVGDFERVAPRVVAQIEAALHPEFVALLVRDAERVLYRSLVAAPAGLAPPPLRVDSKLVALLRVLRQSRSRWRADRRVARHGSCPSEELEVLRQRRIDLLVPIVTNPERAESVLTLGVKRSEEPYTQEDSDLLAMIAATSRSCSNDRRRRRSVQRHVRRVPAVRRLLRFRHVDAQHDRARRSSPVHVPRLLATRYRLDRRLGRGGFGTVYGRSTPRSIGRSPSR